jgi:magnesium transporter
LQDIELIRQIGKSFGLHALVMEDIVNTSQRPKMEEYDDYLFFVVKMMKYDESQGVIKSEQLSMILGKNFLLTFQEQPGDVFEPVRERIRKQKGRIRKVGIDYLAYALLDTVVDNYIFIIERLGEQIEDIEDEILNNQSQHVLSRINDYKREMNYLRKVIRPAREFMLHLSRLDSDLIHDETTPFVKDLLDLASQAVEVIDTYREMLSDHLNIYNTGVNNRLNEIMKVLTIFSAIFIPLTFIAGIYGTNFEYLPELHYRHGYFVMWGVFLIVSLAMFRFFRRKKWL